MKRQIDPNLSSNESEDILFGNENNNSLFKLTEKKDNKNAQKDIEIWDLSLKT